MKRKGFLAGIDMEWPPEDMPRIMRPGRFVVAYTMLVAIYFAPPLVEMLVLLAGSAIFSATCWRCISRPDDAD
jgi:hypothetical protein